MDPEGYIPDDYLFIPSIMDDNPAYSAKTPAGRAYRKMLMAQPKAIRNAWLYGKWTGFEGMYFDCFDKDITVIPHDLLLSLMEKQNWMPIFNGFDWGKVHHSYFCMNTLLELPLADGTRQMFIVTVDELLIKGLSERALAEEIIEELMSNERWNKRITKTFLSPETFGEGAHSRARNIGDVFVSHGIPRPIPAKGEKNSRANGLREMYNLLSDRPILLDGWTQDNMVCGWLISDRCVELL